MLAPETGTSCEYTQGKAMKWDATKRPRDDWWLRITIWETQQATQKLKRPQCFYSVQCHYKGCCTMTHRSPFIWDRIMKVKAGSRGKTNNCMDCDYSNASFGIQGVASILTKPRGLLFLLHFRDLKYFCIYHHLLCLCADWLSVWKTQVSLWSWVLQFYGKLNYLLFVYYSLIKKKYHILLGYNLTLLSRYWFLIQYQDFLFPKFKFCIPQCVELSGIRHKKTFLWFL